MSHLLARFRRHQLEAEQADALREVLQNAGVEAKPTEPVRHLSLVADGQQLRGIPAVGEFCASGAITGTNPEREALRLDGLRRRRV